MALQNKKSFLRARDPSILCPAHFNMQQRVLLDESISDESEHEQEDMLGVYLRLRDTLCEDNHFDIADSTIKCLVPEDSQFGRNVRDGEQVCKMFSFNKIFPSGSSQIHLFDSIVKRKVLKCMNGRNTNLLTYGPSGSGKTFTVVGTNDKPGMIPQSMEYLFRSLPHLKEVPVAKPTSGHTSIKWLKAEEQLTAVAELQTLLNNSEIIAELDTHIKCYTDMQNRLSGELGAVLDEAGSNISVWISFAEIYNECVYDLLETINGKTRKRLKIYNNNGETYIKGLKQIYVSSGQDAYCILQYGLLNLSYAATSVNSHSSRSHCIFTISLVQSTETESTDFWISRINFCDLAGSERSKKTNNVGCRLNESNNINNSLLVLGRCISAIRKAQRNASKVVIPFRESKLTQLFQKALQGEEDISMIVAINPDRHMFDETVHALNFSAIAKEIALTKSGDSNSARNKPISNSGFTVDDYERKIDELQCRVENMAAELWEQRQKDDERENDLRHTLVNQFKEMYYKLKDDDKEELLRVTRQKDKIIQSLQEELEKFNDADSSVISISSSEGNSMIEKIADLDGANIKYHNLFQDFQTVKQEKLLLELEIEDVKTQLQHCLKRLEEQDHLLAYQKLDIIKLREENDCLDNEVRRSILCTNAIIDQYEGQSDGDENVSV